MRAPLIVVVVVVGLGLVASACTSKRESASPDGVDREAAPTCALLDEVVVERVLGEVVIDESLSGASTCTFVASGGLPQSLTIEHVETPTGGSLAALVSSYDMVEIDGVDDQLFWTPEVGDFGHRMLVRLGGSAAILSYVGGGDLGGVQAKLTDLAQRAAVSLPERPFDNLDVVPAAACEKVDIAPIAAEMATSPDQVVVAPLAGVSGCSITVPGMASATVSFQRDGATAESLTGSEESRTVNGTTTVIKSRSLDGVGEAAIWFADGASVGAGELRFVGNGRTGRVTVSGAPDEVGASELAATVANSSMAAAD